MSKDNTPRPVMLIDIKQSRIRIYKKTLCAIGSPQHILLLVNPDERTLAVVGCKKPDPLAHPVLWDSLVFKKSFELHSAPLIQRLCAVFSDWQDNCSHRVYGEIIPEKGIALFHVSDSTALAEE